MDLTLSDVLRLGRRWWWVLLLCMLAAAGVAYLVSTAMTPVYEAESVLLIEQGQGAGSSSYNDILAAERRTTTYSRLVTARPVLDETIRRLGLPVSPADLADAITVSPIRDTQLLRVAVRDPSPARAALIANTLSQVFIDQTRDQQAGVVGTSRDELQQSLDSLKRQIDDATARLGDLKARQDQSDPVVAARIADEQRLISELQSTYSGLLESQQRMDLALTQAMPQVRVAEQAVAPTTFVTPRIKLNVIIAAALGLLAAIGWALLKTYLDDTVKSSADVDRLTGRSALGMIPALRATSGIEALTQPNSTATEAYRGLRTNLQFASAGETIRSLVVTSARPGDGKTTTVANLGVVLAQGGQPVILIDADLRKPRLHTFFGLSNRRGLTNLLLAPADADPEEYLQATGVPGLRVLTTGPLPPNPTDVLNRPRLREVLTTLAASADLVVIDAPPAAVSDPLVLAGLVDGVLLITLSARTRSNEVTRLVQDLARTGRPLVGVVVNRADLTADGYYGYYGYYESDHETDGPSPVGADERSEGRERRPGRRRGRLFPSRSR